MPKVAIVKCEDYSRPNVSSSIKRIFELLRLSELIKTGKKVLLKPNLLMNLPPERGATTHPEIVKAIADEVVKLGAFPFIGDSPGGIGVLYEKVLEATGMKDIGVPIVNFEDNGMRKFNHPGGKIDPIYVSNTALSFDLIINIPKLKTHELTQITCGIKNMFGCVPGLYKVRYHLDAPSPEEFSKELVEIFKRIRPAVTIVDSVIAMEGQGPSNGGLRDLGLIIGSADTVALDAVCSKIMGFQPFDIPTTRIADETGLGEANIDKIDLLGDSLPECKDFKHPSGKLSLLNQMPRAFKFLLNPLINMIRVRPYIDRKRCAKCMMCVNSCPAKAIDGKSFKINKNKCIMCFCCRELCKYNAVELKESLLRKLLSRARA